MLLGEDIENRLINKINDQRGLIGEVRKYNMSMKFIQFNSILVITAGSLIKILIKWNND